MGGNSLRARFKPPRPRQRHRSSRNETHFGSPGCGPPILIPVGFSRNSRSSWRRRFLSRSVLSTNSISSSVSALTCFSTLSSKARNRFEGSIDNSIDTPASAARMSPYVIKQATATIASRGAAFDRTSVTPSPCSSSRNTTIPAATCGKIGTIQSFQMLRSMVQNHTLPPWRRQGNSRPRRNVAQSRLSMFTSVYKSLLKRRLQDASRS